MSRVRAVLRRILDRIVEPPYVPRHRADGDPVILWGRR